MYAKEAKPGKLSLEHVVSWQKQIKDAGLADSRPASPLLIPDYARHVKSVDVSSL